MKIDGRHIWIYDDSVSIGTLARVLVDDGPDISIYNTILNMRRPIKRSGIGNIIIIDRQIWDSIKFWVESGGFAGLTLGEYLEKMY